MVQLLPLTSYGIACGYTPENLAGVDLSAAVKQSAFCCFFRLLRNVHMSDSQKYFF
jgi:hypothetical protein